MSIIRRDRCLALSLLTAFSIATSVYAACAQLDSKKSEASPEAANVAGNSTGMKLLSKEVFIRRKDGRPPLTAFMAYISKTKPVLMHCIAWEDYSDAYDDFSIRISRDNGRTWSPGQMHWKGYDVPEGKMRYCEPAPLFDPDIGKLIVVTDKSLHPKDKLDVDLDYTLVLDIYDPKTGKWSPRKDIDLGGERAGTMSFSFPLKTSKRRLLFPGHRRVTDATGKSLRYKKTKSPLYEMVTVIGDFKPDGEIAWHVGKPLGLAPEVSSRGINENTLAELSDGRIVAIGRGDNSAFPEKPGYKWLSFSRDQGETWSAPVPLPATGGVPIESGGNGSALFRSMKNGKLYWMGNLALNERPKGNWPRSPLVIVEVQEEPFALKRDTIFVVDDRSGSDTAKLQLSNFRFYQDRENSDLVIFLTRYGAESELDWKASDHYRYRVRMP